MRGKFLSLACCMALAAGVLIAGAQPAFAQVREIDATTSAAALNARSGDRLTLACPTIKETPNSIYGTDTYTADSPVCQAAIHAGALERGKAGTVTITIGAGAREYAGSTRNGVTTRNYGAYASSYTFVSSVAAARAGNGAASNPPAAQADDSDQRLVALEQQVAMLQQQANGLPALEQRLAMLEQQNEQLRQFIVINGQSLHIKSAQNLTVQAGVKLDLKGATAKIDVAGDAEIDAARLRIDGPNSTVFVGNLPVVTLGSKVTVNPVTGIGQVTGP